MIILGKVVIAQRSHSQVLLHLQSVVTHRVNLEELVLTGHANVSAVGESQEILEQKLIAKVAHRLGRNPFTSHGIVEVELSLDKLSLGIIILIKFEGELDALVQGDDLSVIQSGDVHIEASGKRGQHVVLTLRDVDTRILSTIESVVISQTVRLKEEGSNTTFTTCNRPGGMVMRVVSVAGII